MNSYIGRRAALSASSISAGRAGIPRSSRSLLSVVKKLNHEIKKAQLAACIPMERDGRCSQHVGGLLEVAALLNLGTCT